MSIFPGKFISKIPFHLHFPLLSNPWLNRNSVIRCSKRREYSSSIPVRYIPKQSSKTQEFRNLGSKSIDNEEKIIRNLDSKSIDIGVSDFNEKSHIQFQEFTNNLSLGAQPGDEEHNRHLLSNPMNLGGSDFNAKHQIQVERSTNMSLDAKSGFEDNVRFDAGIAECELMEVPEEVIEDIVMYNGEDLYEHTVFEAGKTKQAAEKLGIELLAMRAFTAVELRKKLLSKRFAPDIVEGVIDNFQSRGLINDFLYAETFSQSRWSSSSWGPRRIKQALFKKGISEMDTKNALKRVFEDDDCDRDQESGLGMSKVSIDHLFVQASKQWLRGQDVSKETRKARIIRWLQYRGFNWGVVSFILKKLESQYPP